MLTNIYVRTCLNRLTLENVGSYSWVFTVFFFHLNLLILLRRLSPLPIAKC